MLIEGNQLLLDVAGVGYEVEVTTGVVASAPQTGSTLSLFTHFVVREDAQLLFGFAEQQERDLFRAYIRINGVGPKMALALISSISPAALVGAVKDNQIGVLTQVPGVGKRTAERLMVELKSRIETLMPEGLVTAGLSSVSVDRVAGRDAEEALIALGYKANHAAEAVQRAQQALADDSASSDTEALVTWVLRSIGRGS